MSDFFNIDSHENFEESFYIQALEKFVSTGEIVEVQVSDALYDYLVSVMHDPQLQLLVLGNEICGRLFLDNMMRFVDSALKRKKFDISRKQSEQHGIKETLEWSQKRREDDWQALLDRLDESYAAYGFRSAFFRNQFSSQQGLANDDIWISLYKDYSIAFNEYLRQQQIKDIEQKKSTASKRLTNQLTNIPDYLSSHAIEKDDFMQTWGLMGGEWNEYDFQRLLRIAKLQKDYPVLTEIAKKMGRTLDPNGKTSVYAGFGSENKMQHSSKSDIQGISIGNDINSLLPLELAQMNDDDLDLLFTYKYATKSLQTFHHKSEMLRPSRHLERRRAKQCGPMIVAIDSSGSMQGTPQNIARSMLMKLIEVCRKQKREMFIIAFAVSTYPIDVKRDQVKLLDFFAHDSKGDTNATKMMEQVFNLLESNAAYMSSDILFISDFHLPLVSDELLERLRHHRTLGTFFYGLQIGECATNKWVPHLDTIYQVQWLKPRSALDNRFFQP